jgi:hypothetical protein
MVVFPPRRKVMSPGSNGLKPAHLNMSGAEMCAGRDAREGRQLSRYKGIRLPADGIGCQPRNSDFCTSPLYGQLSTKLCRVKVGNLVPQRNRGKVNRSAEQLSLPRFQALLCKIS